MLEVIEQVEIARPAELVAAQFADIEHHERAGPHRGVSFRVIEDTDDHCDYEQVSRVGPMRIRQTYRLMRDDPRHQVNTLTAGAFAPGSVTFDIAAGPDVTTVTATVRSEARGVSAVLAPILRTALKRSLAKGLVEDRRDLESGHYPGPPV